jgi:hypothetical protein
MLRAAAPALGELSPATSDPHAAMLLPVDQVRATAVSGLRLAAMPTAESDSGVPAAVLQQVHLDSDNRHGDPRDHEADGPHHSPTPDLHGWHDAQTAQDRD